MKQILSFALIATSMVLLACTDKSPTQPTPLASPDLGTMLVGEVRVLTYDQASAGLTIPASLASAQYLIVAGNSAVGTDVVPTLTVNGSLQTMQVPPISGSVLAPTGTSGAPTFTDVGGQFGASMEARLRNFERTGLPLARHSTAAGGPTAALSRQVPLAVKAVAPPVNSPLTIKTLTAAGFGGGANPCNSFVTTTGTVRAVTNRSIVVSDNRLTTGFDTTDYQQIADEFETKIYPADVGYFGTPTDLDANSRVIIYYTPSVNLLTPAGTANSSGYVGGFFFAGDLFDQSGCAASNRGEIFYLLAPDPSGVYGNDFSTTFVRQVTRGTVAHEFQHMINAGARFTANAPTFESTWLDEGLAHFAEDAVGRVEAGLPDLQTISISTLNAMDQSLKTAFFNQNFARARYYVTRPDTTGAIVSEDKASQNLASRGAEWLMLRYAVDWFSNGNPRTFTTALATGPDTGVTNLTKRLGAPLDTLLAHWLVTLYTDHSGIQNLDPKYNYKSYTMRDLVTRGYLPVNALGNGSSVYTVGVPPSSGAYFITSQTTGGARTITVSGSGTTLNTKGRFYVVRVQ